MIVPYFFSFSPGLVINTNHARVRHFRWCFKRFNNLDSVLLLVLFKIRFSPIALIFLNSFSITRSKRIVLRKCRRHREENLSVKMLVGEPSSSQKNVLPESLVAFHIKSEHTLIVQKGTGCMRFFLWQMRQMNWFVFIAAIHLENF